MDSEFSTFLTIASIMFSVFIIITCSVVCFTCYRNKKRQAMFSTPVVVTSQSYEPNTRAPYQVSVQTGNTSMAPTNYLPTSQPPPLPSNVPPTTINMPMPMPVHQNSFQPPYPPVTGSAPYPTSSAPYPLNNASASHPVGDANMHPPTYSQIIQNDKHPAFNPSFNG